MKYNNILLVLFLIFNICLHAQTNENYYATASKKEGEELKTALHNIIKIQNVFSYSQVWDKLKITDEDPNNSDNVILLYTGWSYPKNDNGGGTTQWNREHTWAKSMGNFGTAKGPGTDLHHLRPTDVTVNSARGNLYFDNGGTVYIDASRYGGGDGTTNCKKDGDSWEPRDEVKGDVARMLFYMATRYESEDGYDLELEEYSTSSGLHGKLSTLLKWHKNDPVDDWEIGRNERIYSIQNNRNPFIDHPEYVDMIWNSTNSGGDNNEENNDGSTDEYTNVFYEDFENGELGKMTAYNAIGTDQKWYQSNYTDNYFAKMSGYNGSTNEQNEDWLINLNPIELKGYTNLYLSFISMQKIYSGNTSLQVYISNDYDGHSDPYEYTWTDVTSQASFSTDSYNEVESGDIDLEPWKSKSIYIAFKFESSSAGSNTWEIDDIKIKGKISTSTKATSIPADEYKNLSIYPNPSNGSIIIGLDGKIKAKEVRIMNQSGETIQLINHYEYNGKINLNRLKSGIYFIQISTNDNLVTTQKLILK